MMRPVHPAFASQAPWQSSVEAPTFQPKEFITGPGADALFPSVATESNPLGPNTSGPGLDIQA